jgi:hypothetical protein
MNQLMTVTLDETPDGKYFSTVKLAGNAKEFVTADAKTPRIALMHAALILERHHKE